MNDNHTTNPTASNVSQPVPVAPSATDYSRLKAQDGLAHLNETITAECERFEHDLGLRVVAMKIKRDKDSDVLVRVTTSVR